MTYCQVAANDPIHGPYHDLEYGFPQSDETVLCERLALEVFQAGLNWRIVLKKRLALRAAYADFVVDRLVDFSTDQRSRLLSDPSLIRNQRKVDAILHNAGIIRSLRDQGGFSVWLDTQHPLSLEEWVKEFRKIGFRFVGKEIVGEFLMSLGYLRPPHEEDCPVFQQQMRLSPPWMMAHV